MTLEGTPGAPGQAAAGDDLDKMLASSQNVPVHVVQAIRQELQTAKTTNQTQAEQINQLQDALTLYRNQVALMQQSGGAGAQPPGQQRTSNDPLDGVEDDEVITAGQARALLASAQSNIHSQQVMRDLTSRSDFQDVINQHLPNVLRTDPELAGILQSLPEAMRYSLAYRLGQLDPGYKGRQVTDQLSQEAQRIAENLRKPGSPSGVTTMTPSTVTDQISSIPVGSPEWSAFRAKLRNM